MTDISRDPMWYLFDYGMVVSTAPQPHDWRALEHETGLDLQPKTSSYWTNRESFDAGSVSPDEYWTGVLGRAVAPEQVSQLEALDAAQWSHLNADTVSVLETLQEASANLALLSNMPAPMSHRYLAGSHWTGFFSKMYFSGQMGLVKPDVRIFEHVVADLNSPPEDIVFIDDNTLNIETAEKLGFQTVLHTQETDLREELLRRRT
ncbi:haloacid dehalogenase [Arthrobacter sp. NicSoilB4]|uniref:HAD family hydrolase n=1 Tax=Arthrobacter sp. NicSoilB4 TaxID=2830997 RepID=UPI001CC5FD82|nr:HAD family phosphatase [Arthrobacter sp. NicSoilB4]BCW65983.1 haloacid dehalogenase [Arthrobacter sp. NicSoilB4]